MFHIFPENMFRLRAGKYLVLKTYKLVTGNNLQQEWVLRINVWDH